MAKKISRKELLKSPDEFLTLSGKVAIYVKEHTKEFSYAGFALAAIVLIYLGINAYFGYVNKKGQEAYNTAYQSLSKITDSTIDPKVIEESQKLFQKVRDEYGLSKASKLVPPELATLKFQEKKYDEAIELYEEYLNTVSEDTPYKTLARLALSACLEAKGDLEKAIEVLEQINSGTSKFFKEQAIYNLARIHWQANNKEKSKEIYKEFIEQYENSPLLPMAKARLEAYDS